jgi:hypothetical protein
MSTTQSVIARLEAGRRSPSTQTLERLTVATGTIIEITFESAEASTRGGREILWSQWFHRSNCTFALRRCASLQGLTPQLLPPPDLIENVLVFKVICHPRAHGVFRDQIKRMIDTVSDDNSRIEVN